MRIGWMVMLLFAAANVVAEESLPPGPAVPLILSACVQCHDLRWLTAQQKSEAAWRRTVSEMVWRGAPLKPGEVDVVTKYLAAARSHRLDSSPSTRPAMTASTLPAGRGRELVMQSCVQCHDLSVTTSQRKTLAEWRQSVGQMVRLGAKLNGSESEVIARYLTRSFGAPE